MSDYGTMQSRIADEIARSDLTTQIARAIQSAIKFYSRERFYFNEAIWTQSSVASQRYYDVPDDFVEADMMKIRVSGFEYELLKRDWNYLENVDTSPTYTGQPTDWAYFADQFRLYPMPDGVYTLSLSGLSSLSTLSADSDTNAWMVEGEEMIRNRAKADLFLSVIRTPESSADAAACKQMEMEAFASIKGRSNVRLSMGRVRPNNF
jgi:hypothetical protein